eukprot:4603241-Pyramimonas_sp.AAC.1
MVQRPYAVASRGPPTQRAALGDEGAHARPCAGSGRANAGAAEPILCGAHLGRTRTCQCCVPVLETHARPEH